MSHSQKPLSAFSGRQSDTPPESDRTENSTTDTNRELPEGIFAEGSFSRPCEDYPESTISELAESAIEPLLCVQGGVVEPAFASVAGRGGMGARKPIDNPDAAHAVAEACIGLPVIITGGGTNTPMGSGAIFGRLTDVERADNTISVAVYELYHQNGNARREEQTRTLGSYQLSVPATRQDCADAIKALSQWEAGSIDFLNPAARQSHELSVTQTELFEDLSPADRVDTPAYSTTLEVVSEPFETYAVIPRGTLTERTVRVLSVVVSNPIGGYYQLGIDISSKSGSKPNTSIPSCYLSHSQGHPPSPNTAFTRDTSFPSTDLDVTPIDHPTDPTVVPPDEDVLQSPLPEPRMQTALEEIDGIGEKTTRKIRKQASERVTAESLAYALYGGGDTHQESVSEIRRVIDRLPGSEDIYGQLESYTQTGGDE